METIKVYEGKLGTVKVIRYTEEGKEEYQVTHSHEAISSSWHRSKRDAIVQAQFLAGKY